MFMTTVNKQQYPEAMADDLDELLDEVETKFCRNVSLTPQLQAPSDLSTAGKCLTQTGKERKHCTTDDTPRKTDSEDIDALLEDILDDDFDSLALNTGQLPKMTKTLPQSTRKCCPVFLGGSSIANGVGTAVSQRSCDQLRCISCDFRVAMFDDHEWDPSCDYLFFRNNMPDCQKLRAKLRRRKGARAYACQCSWHSARDLTDLREQHQLKWVCGKHEWRSEGG
ncbi:protein C8orf37 homolog [Oncorhynchus tshawytscha]|uniref:Cilia- and flagella-associated protein 418 n=1 Tax=Oncorhynchus tshawytscha TaxID=74940 RepID=A0A8C8GC62_ONCTS|nr:protein C8orf37 homolog [Oncorhynchus tshawytscha]